MLPEKTPEVFFCLVHGYAVCCFLIITEKQIANIDSKVVKYVYTKYYGAGGKRK